MNDIVLEYRKFAKNIALKVGRRCPSHIDVDDIIGDAMVGLIEAARRFDPTRGVSVKTFIFYRIRGAIMEGLRARSKGHDVTFYGDVLLDVEDERESALDIAESAQERRMMQTAIAACSERERALLASVALGLNHTQAGMALGLSRSRACVLRTNAIEKVRSMVVDMTTRHDTMSIQRRTAAGG